MSNIPAGFLISETFFDWFASPCHLVIGKSICLQRASILENWSFISAFNGDIYNIFTEFFPLSAICEIIGRNAASVYPLAVGADIIISLGLLTICKIASS